MLAREEMLQCQPQPEWYGIPLFDHLTVAGFAFLDSMQNGYVVLKTIHSRIYAEAKKL